MAYKQGQDVLKCQPFAYVIETPFRSRVCDFCLKFKTNDGELKKCLGCKFVFYCDKSCQTNAWTAHHREECPFLKAKKHDFDLYEKSYDISMLNSFCDFLDKSIYIARIIIRWVLINSDKCKGEWVEI